MAIYYVKLTQAETKMIRNLRDRYHSARAAEKTFIVAGNYIAASNAAIVAQKAIYEVNDICVDIGRENLKNRNTHMVMDWNTDTCFRSLYITTDEPIEINIRDIVNEDEEEI